MRFLVALILCSVAVSAKRPRCSREQMSAIADCAVGIRPTKGSEGCPSCLPKAFDKQKCSATEMKRCGAPSTCASGVEPTRNGCCVTCKPAKVPKCTKTQRDQCEVSIASLSVCPTSEDRKSFFNAATCCMTCTRPPRANPTKKCTKDDFKTCMDDAPECGAGEKPLREKGQCCVSCRRPARDAPLREVGKCGKLPDCAANEAPIRVKDDSGAFVCPTCKPPRPTCDPACATGQICARTWDVAGAAQASCKAKSEKRLKMRAQNAVDKAFLASAGADEIRATLQEVVDRFCDKEEHAEKCDKFQELVNEGMEVAITKSTADEVGVTVAIPDVAVVVSRRLLSRRLAEDATTLLDDALADPDATGSLTMTEESSTTMPSEGNGAASISASPALLLAFAAVVAALVV